MNRLAARRDLWAAAGALWEVLRPVKSVDRSGAFELFTVAYGSAIVV